MLNRKNLTAALKEARRAILLDVNNEAVFLVEVKDEVATLRSVPELQPKGSFRMSIPYRMNCTYALPAVSVFPAVDDEGWCLV